MYVPKVLSINGLRRLCEAIAGAGCGKYHYFFCLTHQNGEDFRLVRSWLFVGYVLTDYNKSSWQQANRRNLVELGSRYLFVSTVEIFGWTASDLLTSNSFCNVPKIVNTYRIWPPEVTWHSHDTYKHNSGKRETRQYGIHCGFFSRLVRYYYSELSCIFKLNVCIYVQIYSLNIVL